jgi:hypothetical protein
VKQSGNGTRWLPALAVLLLLPLVAFPVGQIAAPNRLGRTVLCTKTDVAELRALADELRRLPKPIFTYDEIFSLPWHSSDGRYPAIVIDGTLHGIAQREGLLAADFPNKLLAPPRFRTVIQVEGHPDVSTLRARGWSCRSLPGRLAGFQHVACFLAASPN